MKKTNFLKLMLTLVLAFVMTGAWAQWTPQTTEGTDSVTVNTRVPYYVEPDTYFNPAFSAPQTNVLSTFSWTIPGAGVTTNLISDIAPGTDNGNYVELTFTATGNYTLQVQETAPSGGCTGPLRSLLVEAINAPSIAYTAAAGFLATDSTFCDLAAAQNDGVRITFTHSVAGLPSLTLDYIYEVDTLVTSTSTWVQADSTNYVGANAITGINAGTYDLLDHAGNFAVLMVNQLVILIPYWA